MEKDPTNVIPIDVMFDIQKMLKRGLNEEEILIQFSKRNITSYIKAYIDRLDMKPKKFNNWKQQWLNCCFLFITI